MSAYADTTAHQLPDDVLQAALLRVVDFHLHAARLLALTRQLLQPDPPALGVHPHPLPDAGAPMAWLQADHATQRTAAALGRFHVVWHLAWTLHTFLYRREDLRDLHAMWRAALDAATHLPDPVTLSRAHTILGQACSLLGLHEEAAGHLDQALVLAVRHHDPAEQARIHWALGQDWGRRGEDRRAMDHS